MMMKATRSVGVTGVDHPPRRPEGGPRRLLGPTAWGLSRRLCN